MALRLSQFGARNSLKLGHDPLEFIRLLRRLGFGHLELLCEPGLAYPRELSASARRELRAALEETNLELTLHAPFRDINLASLNPLIREASARQLQECLELAHDLGARRIVVHPGDLPRDYSEGWLPKAREGLCAALRPVCDRAEELGITLGIENLSRKGNRRLVQTAEEHLTLLAELGPNCKATFDVGHAHTFGLDVLRYLEEVLPRLMEVHLHDNDGTGDQHLPLGAGTIDFPGLFRLLSVKDYQGPLILEVNSQADLERSRDYLLRFI